MIVAVKKKGFKSKKAMFITVVFLIGMFTAYYYHMSDALSYFEKAEKQPQKIEVVEKDLKDEKAQKIEKIIFKEAETIVDLIGQRYIREAQIVKNRLLLVCDPYTDIEPLIIRYGVLALVKNSQKDVKIAVDLKYIVESRYEED